MPRKPLSVLRGLFYLALVVGTIIVDARVRGVQSIRHAIPPLRANADGLAEANGAFKALGCARIEMDDLLGGLRLPVVWCWREGTPAAAAVGSVGATAPYFRNRGCLVRSLVAPVMLKDGKPQFAGATELRAAATPIDSIPAALSYAIAATPFRANPNESYVDERADGYAARLYSDLDPPCGCGDHRTYAVDVLVSKDGGTQEVGRQVVRTIQACID